MKNRIDRRTFMALSAVGGLGALAGCASFERKRMAPNGRLNHACIGVGNMGWADLVNLTSHPNLEVVAICDVDSNQLDRAKEHVPNARCYTDWRELMAKESDKIDSVNVAIPDHMHCAAGLTAIRAGKHLYCQKPLAHDVAECRALTEAAKEYRVVTQLGTQFASSSGDLMALHFLREGVIGKAKRVVLCSNRVSGAQYRLAGPRPEQGETPPDNLNWDLWLGTAPKRPYAPDIYHPMKWRAWQDFGTGWSGDIGCHIFDAVWKGLELTAPKTVMAQVQQSWVESKDRFGDTWPQSDHITWTFPGNDNTEGESLLVEWFDGEIYPPEDVQALIAESGFKKYPEEAALVIGTEGALLLPHGSGPMLFPKEKYKGIERPQTGGPTHYHRFVDACIQGKPANSDFKTSGPMAEAIILGTVAIRVPDTLLYWDRERLRIANNPEANHLLRRDYREGWEVDIGV